MSEYISRMIKRFSMFKISLQHSAMEYVYKCGGNERGIKDCWKELKLITEG